MFDQNIFHEKIIFITILTLAEVQCYSMGKKVLLSYNELKHIMKSVDEEEYILIGLSERRRLVGVFILKVWK